MKALITRFFIYTWVILVIFIGYGLFLPEEHNSQVSITLPLQPHAVWSVLQAVGDYPKWWSEVQASRPIENLPSGQAGFALQFKNGDWIHYHVLESQPGKRWEIQMVDKEQPFSGRWIYELSEQAQGSQLSITEEAVNKTAMLRTFKQVFVGHDKNIQNFAYQLKTHLNSLHSGENP